MYSRVVFADFFQLAPPDGWSFEPAEVALSVDGESDMCSKGQDVDFTFQGFGVTGQVMLLRLYEHVSIIDISAFYIGDV